MLRRCGHDAAYRRAPLAQPSDQLEALIGGDPAGNDQQYAPVLKQIDPPWPSARISMLPPEDQSESDRDERRRDRPHWNKEDCEMAGSLGGLGGQGLGVHDDPFARPIA